MLATHWKRSVLIVENNSDIRESIADMLESPDRTIVQAANGAQALTRLGLVKLPCLVLLGLSMATLDGFGFLEWLDRYVQAGSFPVLLISASPDRSAAENYPGVVGTLRKPFTNDELLTWVDGRE